MATLPPVQDPGYPDVTVLEETDPIQGGLDGIDNRPHKELAERTDHLKARTAGLEAAKQDHEARLNTVEVAGSISVGRAFGLWSGEAADFELFADAPYIWRDIDPRAVIQTVAGDESVDVDSTAGLRVGDAYVIRDDDGGTEVVEVSEILSPQRFRATAILAKSRDATGTLSRTSWIVNAGHALAQDGGVLYSRPIRVLRYDDSGRVILRRDAGDGVIALAVRDAATGGAWTDGPLLTSTAAADVEDRVDLEYQVPLGGVVEVRLTAHAGESGQPIRVDHILALPPPDTVRDLVRRPVAVAPAEGDTDVSETPILRTAAYYSLYGVDQADADFRIARDANMQDLVHVGTLGAAGIEYQVPGGILTPTGHFWWDARHQDAEGQWSLRSEPAGFSCASVFSYVSAPIVIAPAEGATRVSLTPTIILSAFEPVGAEDTHAATRIQVARLKIDGTPDWAAGLLLDVTLGPVTEYTPPTDQALPRDIVIAIRGAHDGATLGAGGWSTTRTFRTANAGDAPVITSPAAGATISLTPTITLSAFSFPGGGEAHVSSQYRITSADAQTIYYDSGETADLTSHTVPGPLPPLTDVRIEARQRGATTGWTPWSEAVARTTRAPSGSATYAVPGTYTFVVPPDVARIRVRVTGGGGGGGGRYGSGVGRYGGGGGGGGGAEGVFDVQPGAEFIVVVPPGGEGTRGSYYGGWPAWGTDGGTASLGALISATGGSGGGDSVGGAGGIGIGSNKVSQGGAGGSDKGASGADGGRYHAGGGGGAGSSDIGGDGGAGGGDGGAGGRHRADGQSPGGGGAGGVGGSAGGAGGAGRVRIEYGPGI